MSLKALQVLLYPTDIHNPIDLYSRGSITLIKNPLKPEKGEQYIGAETGKIYEWDGDKWIAIDDAKAVPMGSEKI